MQAVYSTEGIFIRVLLSCIADGMVDEDDFQNNLIHSLLGEVKLAP